MHKILLLITLPALALVSCSGGGHKVSELDESSPADSMMYYFGQMQASNYWQDAETDTILRSEEARKEFIEGFKAALKMDKDGNAYNKGLQLGVRLAMRLRELNKRYDENFSEEMLASSLEYFLRSDSNINAAEAQKGFYRFKDRFEANAATREIEVARGKLAEVGKARGYQMVSDTLYAKDVTPSKGGVKFKDGDRVALEVIASTLDGQEIVTRQFPDSITIGAGRVPRIVCLGLHTMTPGQTKKFMTTPRTLLGKRYAVYNLPFDEPIIFTVTVAQN